MTYYYPHRKYYLYAVGFFCFNSILFYKEILKISAGGASFIFLITTIMKILIFPIILMLIGCYYKNVSIYTDTQGISIKSWFKKIKITWDEINLVKREGSLIKIYGKNGIISFRPIIIPKSSAVKINIHKNIFKQSELFKEIYLKAKNAQFKNFPD